MRETEAWRLCGGTWLLVTGADGVSCLRSLVQEAAPSGLCLTPPSSGTTQVFTAAALSKRKSCCANRCRHCPFGHYKVQGPRPRVNRLTQPALLQPSPGTRRVAASGAGAAAPSGGAGAESGPEAGVTLVVYEGDAASEALARMMAGAVAAAPSASPAAARGVGCLPQPSAPFVAGQVRWRRKEPLFMRHTGE